MTQPPNSPPEVGSRLVGLDYDDVVWLERAVVQIKNDFALDNPDWLLFGRSLAVELLRRGVKVPERSSGSTHGVSP
jgi:hypothetical protein